MGRKASGQERTDIIERRQKNGSTYVYRRVSAYDSEKGYYTCREQKLLGKKLPGSDEIIPTRPKAPNGSGKGTALPPEPADQPAAIPETEPMSLAASLGAACGIDEDIRRSCDGETASQLIALARYFLMSGGAPVSRIGRWQLAHSMEPCTRPLSGGEIQNLLTLAGLDTSAVRIFSLTRSERLEDRKVTVFDIPSREESAAFAGGGCIEPDRLFVFCTEDGCHPACCAAVPGFLQDAAAFSQAAEQADSLNLKCTEVVTEAGLRPEFSLPSLLQLPFEFITEVPVETDWVRCQADRVLGRLQDAESLCPGEPGIRAVTVPLDPPSAGADGVPGRHLYLHVFLNLQEREEKSLALDRALTRLREQISEGADALTPAARALAGQFLVVRTDSGGKPRAAFRHDAAAEAKKHLGLLVLAASGERDAARALEKVRKRRQMEAYLMGDRQRFSHPAAQAGLRLVRFFGLCLSDTFTAAAERIREDLCTGSGDGDTGREENSGAEKSLRDWLETTPPEDILAWFAEKENLLLPPPAASRDPAAGEAERGRLFLRRLRGLPS